eukprot:1279916-Rhodomonas_salina.2
MCIRDRPTHPIHEEVGVQWSGSSLSSGRELPSSTLEQLEQELAVFYARANPANLHRTREIAYAYEFAREDLNRKLREQYGCDLTSSDLAPHVTPPRVGVGPPVGPRKTHLPEDTESRRWSEARLRISALFPPRDEEPVVRRLRAFYSEHNPEQVQSAQEVADVFRGRENDLNWRLRQKYGCDLSSLPLR